MNCTALETLRLAKAGGIDERLMREIAACVGEL